MGSLAGKRDYKRPLYWKFASHWARCEAAWRGPFDTFRAKGGGGRGVVEEVVTHFWNASISVEEGALTFTHGAVRLSVCLVRERCDRLQ